MIPTEINLLKNEIIDIKGLRKKKKVDQENMEKCLLKEWKTLRNKYPNMKIRKHVDT